MVKLLMGDKDVDHDAMDGAGRSALEVVQHILGDDVGGSQDFKDNLEEIRTLLSQVSHSNTTFMSSSIRQLLLNPLPL